MVKPPSPPKMPKPSQFHYNNKESAEQAASRLRADAKLKHAKPIIKEKIKVPKHPVSRDPNGGWRVKFRLHGVKAAPKVEEKKE